MIEKYLIVHGPNMNLLGERETEIYGSMTLDQLNEKIKHCAKELKVELKCFQSNHEGEILDFLHENRNWANGIVINPAALTHYSYSLRDALSAIQLPTVEVHLSNVLEREPFRHISVVETVCCKRYIGMGAIGYLRGIEYLVGQGTVKQIGQCATSAKTVDTCLRQVVQLLKARQPKYTWVGIYLLEENELVLHNFLGRPTPHARIPLGTGICGAAVTEGKSILIPDVKADPRYLACSIETKSEIVVPIFTGNTIIGEIDIDSDLADVFHEDDQSMLVACASMLGDVLSGGAH